MSNDDFDVTKMMTANDVTKFQTVIFSDVAKYCLNLESNIHEYHLEEGHSTLVKIKF